jgi:predicted transcriptional regulator
MEQDLSVNRQVSRLMEERGMSRVRLAVMSGIPYDLLCRALRGERPFYADELPSLARALRVNADKLLELKQEG